MEIQLYSIYKDIKHLKSCFSLNYLVLFYKLGHDSLGMHEIAFHSIVKLDSDLKSELS